MEAATKGGRAHIGVSHTRRSTSGGGDGGVAGLGATHRSHTMDSVVSLSHHHHPKSRSRGGGGGGGTKGVSGNSGGANTGANNSSSNNHKDNNRQHYQHKHSRAVTSLNGASKSNSHSNNNNINTNNSKTRESNSADALLHQNSANGESKNGHKHSVQTHKKGSRRTVSLPKAGSRLVSHNHQHQSKSASSSVDAGANNNNNNNNITNPAISSATTHSHHLSDCNGNGNTNTNNVFPPIPGGQVGVMTSHLEPGVKEEGLLSPRLLAGASRMATRGGDHPSTAVSRLHFLSEPTNDSLQPRTPPILPSQGIVNGVNGGGAGGAVRTPGGGAAAVGVSRGEGGNRGGTTPTTPVANGLRNSSLSPTDPTTAQQQQQQHQQPLFSPGSSSDRAKGKFEKKVQLSAVTEGSTTPQLPSTRGAKTTEGLGGPGNNNSSNNNNNNNNNNPNNSSSGRDSHNKSRRESGGGKSLPKIAPPEEPFSIRRKIEQFRKWHEEQYTDKLKRFESDASAGGGGAAGAGHVTASLPEGLRGAGIGNSQPASCGLVDYAKLLEGRIAAGDSENCVNGDSGVESGGGGGGGGRGGGLLNMKSGGRQTHLQHFGRDPEDWSRRHPVTTIISNGNGDVTTVKSRMVPQGERPVSAATWKTWRDVNTSDAYKDVKKYIRDNDLMDEEREAWIKSWIADVEKAMGESGDQAGVIQRSK